MKKGLLSLLAVALTIVSCQNYDDQFAELTTIVNGLKTEVAGISAITTEVGSLKSKVDGLVSSLGNIPTTDNTASIAQLVTDLGLVGTEIDALELLLADVTDAADIKVITDALTILSTNVDTLLSATGEVSGSIVINSSATLATAGEFIILTTPSPAAYVVTGLVNIDHTDLTAAEITLANQLTSKILGVGASLTTSGSVELPKLSYVTLNYARNGKTAPNDGTLTSIGGDFTIDGKQLTVNFPVLTSVLGNIAISTPASVTSIDLSAITTIGGASTLEANNAVFANALTVNTGKFPMASVSAAKATSVVLGQTGAVGALSITAPVATSIDANLITSIAGLLTVTATDTTIVHFDKLVTNTAITCGTRVSQFHLPALVTTGGAISINAGVIDFTKLKTVVHAVTLTGAAVTFPGLKAINADGALLGALTLTGGGGTALDLSSTVIDANGSVVSTATSISIKSIVDANLGNILNGTLGPKSITIGGQLTSLVLDGATGHITSLSVMGGVSATVNKDDASLIDFTAPIAGIAAMTSMTVGNFGTVDIGTTANTTLLSVVTNGNIESLELQELNGLTSASIGHGSWSSYPNPLPQTIIMQNLGALVSVDLSAVTRLNNVDIQTNAKLATITAPATPTSIVTTARFNAIIDSNALVATSTAANIDGNLAEVKQPSLSTWKAYINAFKAITTGVIDATPSPTSVALLAKEMNFEIDYDFEGDGTTDNNYAKVGFIAGTNRINTFAELATIDSNTP